MTQLISSSFPRDNRSECENSYLSQICVSIHKVYRMQLVLSNHCINACGYFNQTCLLLCDQIYANLEE